MHHESDPNKFLSVLGEFGVSMTPIEHWERATSPVPSEVTLFRSKASQKYTVLSSLTADGYGHARVDHGVDTSHHARGQRLLLLADRLNLRTMTACRNRDIDYVDLAGNALLRFSDVYIDVQGRSLNRAKTNSEARRAPVNLFSTRRAQVIFVLIVWPELFTLPLRYTSEAAGVSIGSAFQTIRILKESGYMIGEANPSLVRKNELIDRWTDAFATGLRNKLVLAKYRGEHLDVVGSGSGARWFVSGERAVGWLLRPTTLTIYVEDLKPDLIAANRWRRDGHPNIEVRKKFWKDPRQIIHENRNLEFREIEPEAPALLIYADLMASGDGRQREAAQSFRNSRHELVDG